MTRPTAAQRPDRPRTTTSRGPLGGVLGMLWALAVVVAVLNCLLAACNVPREAVQADDAAERSVRTAADWIAALPKSDRVLLLLSSRNDATGWFLCRVPYLIYPRRIYYSIDRLPPNPAARYDAVIAERPADESLPSDWRRETRSEAATLLVPGAAPAVDLRRAPTESSRRPAPLLGPAGALLSVVVVCGLGALLLRESLPGPPFASRPANLAAAHLVGAAALAWIETVSIAATGRLSIALPYAVTALLAGALTLKRGRLRPRVASRAEHAAGESEAWRPSRALRGAALVGIVVAVSTAVARIALVGLEGDAFGMWQLKARAFSIDGTAAILLDRAHFSAAHLDYPLLVSIQSWWSYAHFGAASDGLAQALGLLFFVDLIVLFGAFAAKYVPGGVARASLALIACPTIMARHAVSGFADMTFAAYLLAAGGALLHAADDEDRASITLVGWLLVGLVLTKNEGLLGALGAILVTAWALRRRTAALVRNGLTLLGFAAVGILPWLVFKAAHGIRNDLFGGGPSAVPQNMDLNPVARLTYTLNGFLSQLGSLFPRYPGWGLIGLLLLLGLVARARRRFARADAAWQLAGVQLVGYIGIFLVTPLPLVWHVTNSVDRLTLHLIPLLLLAALISCFGRSRAAEGASVAGLGPVQDDESPAIRKAQKREPRRRPHPATAGADATTSEETRGPQGWKGRP